MRKVLFIASVCAFFIGACGTKEDCLKKYGFKSCDDLKTGLNLQDKDEAIKYHKIVTDCGCSQ